MTNFVGRLGVTLGLDSAQFSRGLDAASKKLEQFAVAAASYGKNAALALAAASVAAMQYADELSDVAAANDVAISSVIQLRDALAKSGGEAGNASKLLSSFTQYIDKAAEGSFEAQKTLKNLGISVADLKTQSMEQLFKQAAEGLAEMNDPLTRNAKGMELFGRAGKGVDFVNFNSELKKTTTVSKEHEEGIKAAAEAYDMLADRSRRAMESLAATVGPGIKFAIEQFDKFTDTLSKSGDIALKTAKKYEALFSILPGLKILMTGVQVDKTLAELNPTDQRLASGTQGAVLSPIRNVKPGINKEAEAERKRIFDNWAKGYLAVQAEIADGQKLIDEQAEEMRRKERDFLEKRKQERTLALKQEANEIEDGNRLLSEQASEYQKANAAIFERQAMDAENIRRQKVMLEMADQNRFMQAAEYQFAQDTLAVEWKYADLKKEISNNEALSAADKEAALQRLVKLQEQDLGVAKQRYDIAKRSQTGTFGEGFSEAMSMAVKNATTSFQYGQQAFQTMIGSMDNAITQFVRTGKLSFKDLARSIIQDLIAIQMKAAVMRFLGGMFNPAASWNGANDGWFKNVYMAGAAPPGKATGGPVSAGSPYMVGERGPELFMPSRSGTIIPNNQISSMGSTTNVTNNYISAIDVKSFEDRLLGSSNTIWAANQYANKNLSTNFGRT
jgi:lambda family phage tail tape measure protein